MKASGLLLALALAASTTAVFAADGRADQGPRAMSSTMSTDTAWAGIDFVIWSEMEKARLERAGFPQYTD